jgi:DNA-binding CsgD family transcriptional regulator
VIVLGAAQASHPSPRQHQEAIRLLVSMARVVADQGLGFGALQRDATGEEIVATIAAVAGGLITLDRRLAGDLLATPESSQAPTPGHLADAEEPLTARELEVLQLLVEGLPNKLIAAQLHISEHTVKFHVSAILLKLGAAAVPKPSRSPPDVACSSCNLYRLENASRFISNQKLADWNAYPPCYAFLAYDSQGKWSRLTLPPDRMTPMRLPARSSFFSSSAPMGTAAEGSMTIFMRSQT